MKKMTTKRLSQLLLLTLLISLVFSLGITAQAADTPGKPTLIATTDGNTGTVNFTWASTSNAKNYDLRIFQNGVVINTIWSITANSYSVKLPEGSYAATLSAVSANSSWTTSDSISFSVSLVHPGKPTLIATTDGNTGTVTFTWASTSNAKNYDLRIFQNGVVINTIWSITANSYSIKLPEGSYAATLSAVSANSSWTTSDSISFNVSLVHPGKPTLKATTTDGNTGTVTFTWASTSNAKNYDLRIFQNGVVINTIWSITANSYSIKLPEGSYTATLSAVSANNSWTTSDSVSFGVSLVHPGKPTLKANKDGNTGTVNFTWASASNAKHYDLRIFQNGVVINTIWSITNNSYSMKLPEGSYTATLSAVSANNSWTTSDSISFVIGNLFVRRRDDYSFYNSSSSFGYSSGYKIPVERYRDLFGVTTGDQLYSNNGSWGGSCFGFSTSASDFFIGGLSPSTYYSSAKCVFDIPTPGSPGNKTTQMIETYQISWYINAMWGYNYSHRNDYAGLIEAVKPGNRSKNGIVALSVFNYEEGHTIVAYDITETASEYVISYYNNWYSDGRTEYLYIKKNSPSMRFSDSSMENRYGSAHGLTDFYFVTSSEVRSAMLSNPKGSGDGTLITVSSKDVVVYDSYNNPVPESYIIPPAPNSASDKILFSLPDGGYSIRADRNTLSVDGEPFVIGISDNDNYIRLSSDSSDFDVTFTLGATPNLLLSNVDSVIDGQITSTNPGLSERSLHISSIAPGEYKLSFFDPYSPPKQDDVITLAPSSAGKDGAKQLTFTIG